jgi:hypothetical protein
MMTLSELTLIIISYESCQCLDGINVSIEDRNSFINCVIRRDQDIEVNWDKLVDKKMLDELNIPNGLRRDIKSTQLMAYLKDQTRARLAEVSFND